MYFDFGACFYNEIYWKHIEQKPFAFFDSILNFKESVLSVFIRKALVLYKCVNVSWPVIPNEHAKDDNIPPDVEDNDWKPLKAIVAISAHPKHEEVAQ